MIYLENLILFNRLIIRDAARHLDEKSPKAASLCALAKLHGTENCFEVSYAKLVLLNSIFEFELLVSSRILMKVSLKSTVL